MHEYFCTKCCSSVWHTTLHKCVASCCIYLMYPGMPNGRKYNFQERILQLNKRTVLLRVHRQGFLAAKQPRAERPRLPHVGSHVGEVPGAEIKLQNVTDLKWRYRLPETIRLMVHSSVFANLFRAFANHHASKLKVEIQTFD